MLLLKTSGSFSADYDRESAILSVARKFPRLDHPKVLKIVSGDSFTIAKSSDLSRLHLLQEFFSSIGIDTEVELEEDKAQPLSIPALAKCSACGVSAPTTGARFCPSCGAKLGQSTQSRADAPTSPPLPAVPSEVQRFAQSEESTGGPAPDDAAAKAAKEKRDARNGLMAVVVCALAFFSWHHYRSTSTASESKADTVSAAVAPSPETPASSTSGQAAPGAQNAIAPSPAVVANAPANTQSKPGPFTTAVAKVFGGIAAFFAFIVGLRIPPLFYSQWDRYRTARISIMFWQLVAGSAAGFFAFSFVLGLFGVQPPMPTSQQTVAERHSGQHQVPQRRNIPAPDPQFTGTSSGSQYEHPIAPPPNRMLTAARPVQPQQTLTAAQVGDDDRPETSDASTAQPR